MFVPTLKLLFSFLLHCVKRSVYEVKMLVLGSLRWKDLNRSQQSSKIKSSIEESVCNIDNYVLQDKGTEFLFNIGFININGDVKLNGRVEGLKNIKETRHDYYFKNSELCTMVEIEASELVIHYDGNVKILSIGPTFLINAVLKNVKVLIEFKIYPFEHMTFYVDKVMIEELKIKALISDLNIISWIINLMIIISLKVMSFMILCFLEFHTKCYLNETFSKFYLSQNYVLEKVVKDMVKSKSARIEPGFRAEIEILREISNKSKPGCTSYIYSLMTGLFEFNKTLSQVVIAKVLNESFKECPCNTTLQSDKIESDLSNTVSSESESDSNSSSSESESGFDNSGIRQENRITSDEGSAESEVDSHNTENDCNNETVSFLSSTSSEDILSQSENNSQNASNLRSEESYSENELRHENDSRDENSFQFEESYSESEPQPESESYEEKRYQNYYQTGICSESCHSEKNYDETYQPENNSKDKDYTQPENNTTDEDGIQPENNSYDEGDNSRGGVVTQPENNSYDEGDNSSDEDGTRPENNSYGEDDYSSGDNGIQPENNSYDEIDNASGEYSTQHENSSNGEYGTHPENNSSGDNGTHRENNSSDEDNTQRENNSDGEFKRNDAVECEVVSDKYEATIQPNEVENHNKSDTELYKEPYGKTFT